MSTTPTDASEPSTEELERFLTSDGAVADAMGLDEQDLEVIYNVAYNEYEHGQYAEAAKTFAYLCELDHLNPRNWMGLGAACQMAEGYDGAAAAYAMAAELENTDPAAPLHAAECFLAMGMVEEATDALNQAIEWAVYAANPEEVYGRVEVINQALTELVERYEAGELTEAAEAGAEDPEAVRS